MTVLDDSELAAARTSALAGLLQAVGYALWQAAECEDVLAHWVIIALRSTRGVGEEAAAPITDAVQRRTFGQLMAELRDAEVLPPDLMKRVEALVRERNWLVHHAKRENRGVLNDIARFDAVVARITRIAEEATKLDATLGRLLEERVVASGVDRQLIDKEAERLARGWGYEV